MFSWPVRAPHGPVSSCFAAVVGCIPDFCAHCALDQPPTARWAVVRLDSPSNMAMRSVFLARPR